MSNRLLPGEADLQENPRWDLTRAIAHHSKGLGQ
jgi:hypothetical protein